ncbi:MAG: hypothetical protein IJD53_00885 [Alistipes sp.]|nr:hypothetical protein [Alistipes sp.]
MKRIILIFAAITFTLSAAEAQDDTRYSQGVFTETTTITRTKVEKIKNEHNITENIRGFKKNIELGLQYGSDISTECHCILGYRFNNLLFLGGGTGIIYFAAAGTAEDIAIPIYINSKLYLTKSILKPYISLSIGTKFSNGGVQGGYYVSPSIGIDRAIRDNLNWYLSVCADFQNQREYSFEQPISTDRFHVGLRTGLTF